MKIRAHKLAKELGMSSKELIVRAKTLKITIKNSMSGLSEPDASRLREKVKGKPAAEPVKEKAPAKPVVKQKTPESKAPKKKEDVPESATVNLIHKLAKEEKTVRALRPSEMDHFSDEKAPTDKEKERKHGRIIRKTFTRKGVSAMARRLAGKPTQKAPAPVKKETPADLKIHVAAPVTVKKASEKLGVKANLMIKKLMDHGIMVSINDTLDEDAIIFLGLEFNCEIEVEAEPDLIEKMIKEAETEEENTETRSPIITLMGHVDHGKTSLLDKFRSSKVVDTESGKITQHIGAYEVMVNDKKIVFLDTPGHESFTHMRARGARVTDIVVLVVAADDGVMPQTEEAINHARAAKVPIVVAINKVDKKDINLAKVKQQLANLDLIPEEWSGKTIFVEVSALTGQGVDNLLEMLVLQSEILELKTNSKRKAYGVVLEAKLTGGQGVFSTVLVQNGTLQVGDVISCGKSYGKVRAMYDTHLKNIRSAGPASAVGITGLPEVPEAGDRFYSVANLQMAKEISKNYANRQQTSRAANRPHITLETLYDRIQVDKIKEVKIILKADVKGSLEVIQNMLGAISTEEVKLKIIHAGVGRINESDVILADASDAIIVGFHVGPEERARQVALERKVDIKQYDIIYQLADNIKLALEGLLEPEKLEVINGHLNVRNTFKISKLGTIAGCAVIDGKVERSNQIRVKRENKVIFEGKLTSLKRFKDDVREVAEGFECGVKLNNFDDIRVGDIIEAYFIEEKARKLETKTSS